MSGLLAGALVLRAELPAWLQNLEATSPIRAALMKVVSMPSGAVSVRRPPRETRTALTEMIGHSPTDAELIAMRARAAEEQLDFTAAEQDWQRYVQVNTDRAGGLQELADFYHRRLRPPDEVKALSQLAQLPLPQRETFLPASAQTPWRTFERIQGVVDEQSLPAATAVANYRAWIARYPRETSLYPRFLEYVIAHKQVAAGQQLLAAYTRAFPEDRVFPVRVRAAIEQSQGSAEKAVAVYDQAFDPLWPPELVQSYFAMLQPRHHLRDYLAKARAALASNPGDVRAAARIFYYYQQQGNLQAAQQPLLEFAQRREASGQAWPATDLWTLGQLFEGVQNYPEAARFYYALYSLPGADAASSEKSLAAFYNLLMTAPEQAVAFGADDISLYRDVATMDPHPGFLNGILSLILNTTQPEAQYAQQARTSVAYFHRGGAAQLLALFDRRFPTSAARPEMHARLIEAYASYGEDDAVIAAGQRFLSAFPNSGERTRVALLTADSFARKGAVNQEFATYDALLKELAARAGGVPLGAAAAAAPAVPRRATRQQLEQQEEEQPGAEQPAGAVPVPQPQAGRRGAAIAGVRSPDYARVLDRYISRLVSMKRPMDALALYRREIDRNPNDPGLYERQAAFLEQNRLAADVEQVYRRAIQQFPERSWYHKLARWYLRQRQAAAFAQLTRDVVKIFSGSELESYFKEVVGTAGVDARLYRQLNEFAHQRFPSNLAFVKNLIHAYTTPGSADPAAYQTLLRNYWFWDGDIRTWLFQTLSYGERLSSELNAVLAAQPAAQAGRWREVAGANPAAARFVAEAEAWRSHFESAAAPMNALAAEFPAEMDLGRRAASLNRSLIAFDPAATAAAVGIEENLNRADPTSSQPLTAIGEIYADAENYARARPYWDRIPQIRPGKPDGYLEAATVFWDYFQFDDTLRLIGAARRKFGQPALYAYEAGAVYENKRDYSRAVTEYAKGALAAPGESSASSRLLALARRPAMKALIDKATDVPALAQAGASAVDLRVKVLEAQNRRADLESFLLAVVQASSSPEVLTDAGETADRLGLDAVRERAYQRQVAVTTDPIERIRLRLALAKYYEGRAQVPAARREMEAVYADNPRSLGVVRATVDFYWRNKLSEPAVDTLLAAAGRAYPQLKTQFTYEAARKDTEAARYAPARQLLDALLKQEPANGEYLAAMADTFAREGNDTALRDFYNASIQTLSQAQIEPAERTARVASLRRGLILALTRLRDYPGAIDQYIEIINRYPEDEGLVREAALYAADHNLQPKLVSYYTQTATRSPRDFRWPMVLARLDTALENFPDAIAAYSAATKIRPDRVDLHTARASLEVRLLRFDDAARDYANIYELAYHDPQWMGKVAEIRARQGRTDDAVRALSKALIEGRPERPGQFFEAALRLESWGMLAPARQFAERGVKAVPSGRMADSEYASGLQTYARVMTRVREQAAAFELLHKAESAGGEQYSLRGAFEQMGDAVKTYFTPEEKTAFVRFLEQQKASMGIDDLRAVLLPLAEHAGLAELQANWLYESVMATPGQGASVGDEARLVQLQSRRVKYRELGQQFEALWKAYPNSPNKSSVLIPAIDAYHAADDWQDELRLLTLADRQQTLDNNHQRRYFELLLANQPQRLVDLAGAAPTPDERFAAASYAVANGDNALALRAIESSGRRLPPVWTRAYTGLIGLYLADAGQRVNAAFTSALGNMQIGARLTAKLDRDQQLAGDTWFYYGSRYGEYLEVTRRPNGQDFLPAEVEGHPARSSAYFTLAEYYRERGDGRRALPDYQHALELNARRADAHLRIAGILWEQGNKPQAVAHWKQAIENLGRQQDSGRVPESFWEDMAAVLKDVREHKVLDQVRPEADRVLRNYIRRNGPYRVQPLLEAAVAAAPDPAAGMAWLLELSRAAADPATFLAQLVDEPWLPEGQKGLVYDRIVEAAANRAAQQFGQARETMLGEARQWELKRLDYLLAGKQTARARSAFDALPEDVRRSSSVASYEIRLVAQEGKLDALLERYRREPESLPELQVLPATASTLREQGNTAASQKLLEFFYTRQLQQQNLDAANFLGLAEVRLDTGDAAGALRLLRRMTLVSGEAFETQVAAANLLEKKGRHAEAAEFVAERVKAVPWDAAARLQLAREQIGGGKDRAAAVAALNAVTASRDIAYATRADAAILLGRNNAAGGSAGSAELDLLAKGAAPTPADAQQPFFYRARVEIAARPSDAAGRVQLLTDAIALDPDAAPEVRVSLEHAAVESGRYQAAVGAMRPLLERGGMQYMLQEMERAGGEAPARRRYRSQEGIAQQFLSGIGLDDAARSSAARDLAVAFEKMKQLRGAQMFMQAALDLQPSDALRQALDRLDAEVVRNAANAKRRPVLSANLEQPEVVRPRLRAPARAGGAQ